MLNLMTEFGLERLDTRAPAAASLKPETYFINGRHYTQAQATRAFVPIAKRIFADYDELGEVVELQDRRRRHRHSIRQSITQYLDGIGVTGWMRELIDVAYVTEYGLESSEQSALNFFFLIGTGDLEDPETFALLGESDERYKVRGGNQQVVDELARRVAPQIRTLHRLEAIRTKGQGFTLTFQTDGKVVDHDADVVVLTVPFSILREVKMQVELPPLKTRAIRELGVRRERQGAGRLPQPAVGEARVLRRDLQRRDVPTRVGEQLAAAGRGRRLDAVLRWQARARRRAGHGRGRGRAADAGDRARVSGRDARAQRQGVPHSLADVPVDEGQLLLLQARPMDDDRRVGRACRSAISSSPANTAATTFRDT